MQPIEAYEILKQRQLNEDRVLAERTSKFFLAISFLFLAFVALLNPSLTDPIFNVLRILLPIAGIFLSCVLYGVSRAAVNAIDFWHIAQRKIEEEAGEFDYMRGSEITPHIDADKCIWGAWEFKKRGGRWVLVEVTKGSRRWLRHPILWVKHEVFYLPPIFLALWVASLIVAIIMAIN